MNVLLEPAIFIMYLLTHVHVVNKSNSEDIGDFTQKDYMVKYMQLLGNHFVQNILDNPSNHKYKCSFQVLCAKLLISSNLVIYVLIFSRCIINCVHVHS